MNAKKRRQKLKNAMPKRGSLDAKSMKKTRKEAQNLRRLKRLEGKQITFAPVSFRLNSERLPGESFSKYRDQLEHKKAALKHRLRGVYISGSMAGQPVPPPAKAHKLANGSFRKKTRKPKASKGKFLSSVQNALGAVRKSIRGNSDK